MTLKIRRNLEAVGLLILIMIQIFAVRFLWSQKITEVSVTGNKMYTTSEIEEFVFPNELSRNTVYIFLGSPGKEEADQPFLDHVNVELTGESSADLVVYEKSIMACFRYMGSYMYFDRDGVIVGNSFEYQEGTPVIDGLDFSSAVLNRKLDVEDDSIFTDILNLTNVLEKNKLNVDKILYESESSVLLYLGDVRVRLGDLQNMEEKVHILSLNLSALENLSGVFHLEDYEPGKSSYTLVFEKD